MNIFVLLAHPDKFSLNKAIADTVIETLSQFKCNIIYHDLYAENFDPILQKSEFPENAELPAVIKQHCDEISNADGIIIIHPNWWGQPPAILKGWIDRVIRPGVAYKFTEGDSGEGVPIGLLKTRFVIIFNTSDTPEERELTVFGDPLELIWKNCIFNLCGISNIQRKMYRVVINSTFEERKKWLEDVKTTTARVIKETV